MLDTDIDPVPTAVPRAMWLSSALPSTAMRRKPGNYSSPEDRCSLAGQFVR